MYLIRSSGKFASSIKYIKIEGGEIKRFYSDGRVDKEMLNDWDKEAINSFIESGAWREIELQELVLL